MAASKQYDLIFLIDMDGVLVDFVGGWLKEWNSKYPDRKIDYEPTDFYLETAYSNVASEEEIKEIMDKEDFFFNLDPLPGAIEGFRQMEQSGLTLFLCSSPSRFTHSFEEKAAWVEMHLGQDWIDKLILTRDKTMVHGDYLIDDKPVIKGVYDPSWEHILFDASYNRDEDSNKQFRITWKTWPSLLMYHAGFK